MSLLAERLTEYEIYGILLPWLFYFSLVGYPLLQAFVFSSMKGRWRKAGLIPVLPMILVAVLTARNLMQGSVTWVRPLTVVTPVAFLYLTGLSLAHEWHRRTVQLVSLATIATALLAMTWSYGFGQKLGGPPAPIGGEYRTEGEWIATEIARDLEEMLAYPHPSAAADVRVTPLTAGIYRIATTRHPEPVELDLSDGFWNPEKFAGIAGEPPTRIAPPPGNTIVPLDGVPQRLLEASSEELVHVSQDVSRALSLNIGDRTAHEAAALTLAAFALGEAAGRFQDVRWALSRITAHLAVAQVLADANGRSMTGQLARAALLTLSNEQVRALTLLDELDAEADDSASRSWTTALRTRITQDWRLVRDPASATVMEKSEYLRARREGAFGTRAAEDLDAIRIDPETSAHWLRLVQNGYRSVEDGHLIVSAAQRLEWQDASRILSVLRGTPQDASITDLNLRATRCITASGPVVLPWGAWAEFHQRHLAMMVGNVNRQFVVGVGSPRGAAESNFEIDKALRHLSMFPLGTTFRLRGPKGGNADLRYINPAIRLSSQSPELVTPEVWAWLDRAAGYEPVRQGMPTAAAWFAGQMAPYDAAARAMLSGNGQSAEQLERLLGRAPHDYGLQTAYLRAKFGERIPFAELQRVMGDRLSHDLRAINYTRKYISNDDQHVAILRGACEIRAVECVDLAPLLIRLGRDDEAAAAYERAFADGSVDEVLLANSSGWLVDYLYRGQRLEDARALAARAASVGSSAGLVTMARLEERLGNPDEAERLYEQAAKRYEDPSLLLGFYLRRTRDFRETSREPALQEWLPRVFPDGLQPVAPASPVKPLKGVIIVEDTDRARRVGIQTGDIIVALEGVRVDNLAQYYAINGSYDTPAMKLTLWRGRTFEVSTIAPNRLVGVRLRSHPVEGWSE